MIRKFKYGTPIETESVIENLPLSEEVPEYGTLSLEDGFSWSYVMADEDVVYGLGEANRGINKRGWIYISDAKDYPYHKEDVRSLYAAHNFVIIDGKDHHFGLFIDYPSYLTFDIGYTKQDTMTISCEEASLYLYTISGESSYDIVKQFLKIIGRSYIPPKFAFGFGQSRFGYKTEDDFRLVVQKHRDAHVPMDMLYMDIDYMDHYKDFTVNPEEFPDFKAFVDEMAEKKIHLVPIIDAGVKVEEGYPIYEEGIAGDYFCKDAEGKPFESTVWPGWTHYPDVLEENARKWFGDKYKVLTDAGIDAFWNDMNEPSIFYSREGLEECREAVKEFLEDENGYFKAMFSFMTLSNSHKDFDRFYHKINGQLVPHSKVHNLYGYNMTRAAGEAFKRLEPNKRILMFSRSSYVGMHRYGGIWTGDNCSWWSHLLMNLKQMPSLNMCGFLYTGSDLGGFGEDTTRDLLLRWLALGVFTPLMRNHSAMRTREQEFYQFEGAEDFRHIIEVRYRLVPYLYSEYMKAALNYDMLFKPMAFVYPEDCLCREIEDQVMIGNEIMITPVYTQNATGRYVYLPEDMTFVKFMPDGSLYQENLQKGHHYVKIALNEVPLFIRKGKCIPVADKAETVGAIDYNTIQMVGSPEASYDLYDDDGVTPID